MSAFRPELTGSYRPIADIGESADELPMRMAFASCLAMLVAACSFSRPHLAHNAHAPAGWQAFCFPATIAYLPDTDRVSPGTEGTLPAIYDLHLRHTEWLLLSVSGGPDPNDRTARQLATRRAQSALRLLTRLGARHDRVEVRILYDREVDRLNRDVDAQSPSPDAPHPMDWAAFVVTMIPPEQVERNRALERENPSLVFC